MLLKKNFRHFANPTPFTYAEYKGRDEQFSNAFKAEQMFAMAQEHFEAARNLFDKQPQHVSIDCHTNIDNDDKAHFMSANEKSSAAKVAKNNYVVMKILSSRGLKNLKVNRKRSEQTNMFFILWIQSAI